MPDPQVLPSSSPTWDFMEGGNAQPNNQGVSAIVDTQLLRGLTLKGKLVGTNGSTRLECGCGVSTRDPRVSPETRVIACRTCCGRRPTVELGIFMAQASRAAAAAEQALATLRTYRTHARWTHCESFAFQEASQLAEQGNFPAAQRVAEEGVAELYRKLGRTPERRNGRPHRR